MGCCCSICTENDDDSKNQQETELSTRSTAGSSSKSLTVSRAMSAPSIEVENGLTVSGYGLALIGTTIEQDAAYWEIHSNTLNDDREVDILCGVTTRKDRKFYEELNDQNDSQEAHGTEWMRKVKIRKGDIVGVAVQQSDLPMVQFLINGEPIHDLIVNRFRGSVYPAVYLPESGDAKLELVFEESDFKQLSPSIRFGPLIIARGLI